MRYGKYCLKTGRHEAFTTPFDVVPMKAINTGSRIDRSAFHGEKRIGIRVYRCNMHGKISVFGPPITRDINVKRIGIGTPSSIPSFQVR
jgi:hypothetical protein